MLILCCEHHASRLCHVLRCWAQPRTLFNNCDQIMCKYLIRWTKHTPYLRMSSWFTIALHSCVYRHTHTRAQLFRAPIVCTVFNGNALILKEYFLKRHFVCKLTYRKLNYLCENDKVTLLRQGAQPNQCVILFKCDAIEKLMDNEFQWNFINGT